ncbi:MAG: glycosyltransferase family 2 protein [Acetobacteraceae bacterium]
MTVSVVIRTCNEAARLRLTLQSLREQPCLTEIVAVDDGSCDATPAVLAEAAHDLPLVVRRHERPQGRAAASNAGAAAARGAVILFLDGDTLAGPGMVARHAALHAAARATPLVGRGELLHLRCTRFFLDPETLTPRPEEIARVARMSPAEREAARVTAAQVRNDFPAIARRAQPGVYPGAGPRLLAELEQQALRDHPDCTVLWVAASGSNFSMPRDLFLASGGFRPDLDINEHRELAIRLSDAGAAMRLVADARSYHLTHRTGWRDPMTDRRWEHVFTAAHPHRGLPYLLLFWAGLADRETIPPVLRISSIIELEQAILGRTQLDEATAMRLVDAGRRAA